ncbi:MAG: hypothetical protein K5770_10615 [Lachnospiraceae bacterium]|nr:hypothetical protein [Lachnospiraceae bacterium]
MKRLIKRKNFIIYLLTAALIVSGPVSAWAEENIESVEISGEDKADVNSGRGSEPEAVTEIPTEVTTEAAAQGSKDNGLKEVPEEPENLEEKAEEPSEETEETQPESLPKSSEEKETLSESNYRETPSEEDVHEAETAGESRSLEDTYSDRQYEDPEHTEDLQNTEDQQYTGNDQNTGDYQYTEDHQYTQEPQDAYYDEEAEQMVSEDRGSAWEEQQEEIPEPEQDDFSENEDKDGKAKLITAFGALSEEEKTRTYPKDGKPSYDELVRDFPAHLTVYTEDGMDEVAVEWFSVGDDFDGSAAIYYQFSPRWDTGLYRVEDDFDILRDAPYIEVFLTEPESSYDEASGEALPSNIILNYNQTANKRKIYDYLTGTMGLNTAAACGVLANIYCESGFNPNALGDGGTSYGICQWHNGRYTNLRNYCDDNGYDYRSLIGQLHFLEYELNHSYGSILRLLESVFNDAEGAYYAGYSWCYNYERPRNYPSVSVTRGNLARDKYWASYTGEYSGIIELETPGDIPEEDLEEGWDEYPDGISEEGPSFYLSQTEMNLIAGGSGAGLDISCFPEDSIEYSVTWESADKDIVYVSYDGFVLPKEAGETMITAYVKWQVHDDEQDENGDGGHMPDEFTELSCRVLVEENVPVELYDPETVDFYASSEEPVKIGRNEAYISVGVSYKNAVAYTGETIDPENDLGAEMNLSELTGIIDELGLLREEGISSAELFDVSYQTQGGIYTGGSYFYPVIFFDEEKAYDAGMKRREIEELSRAVSELNEDFSERSFDFYVNPVDISGNDISVLVRLDNRRIVYDEEGNITNIRYVRITDKDRRIFDLPLYDCEIRLMDFEAGRVILTVADNECFTGSKEVYVN